ncbi:MAG: hypothetical protein ACR2KL_11885 [Nocardioidaceae bacterium]
MVERVAYHRRTAGGQRSPEGVRDGNLGAPQKGTLGTSTQSWAGRFRCLVWPAGFGFLPRIAI